MNRFTTLLAAATLAASTQLQAHSVWINSFESHAHAPGHTMVSLGWGHALPMDDILTSPNGRIAIQQYELIAPDLSKTDLGVPEFKLSTPELETANFDLYTADLGARKIALKKESAEGVYQLSAVSVPTYYTQYVDKDGRQRLKLKSKDQLDDIGKVLMSVKYQAFAKSYLTVGEWTAPKPLGHGLEIIPRTDLSDLHVGDLVEVDVLFYGEPVNSSAKSIKYITAHSNSFGQSDGFKLVSFVTQGKAQFRVQSSGQWMVGINHKQDVTPDGPLKDLQGKTEHVYTGASLTFTVK